MEWRTFFFIYIYSKKREVEDVEIEGYKGNEWIRTVNYIVFLPGHIRTLQFELEKYQYIWQLAFIHHLYI